MTEACDMIRGNSRWIHHVQDVHHLRGADRFPRAHFPGCARRPPHQQGESIVANHNGAYSGLAATISEQLSIFNALLGGIGDHADGRPTPVTMTDVASGREMVMTNSQIRFKGPQVISDEVVDGKIITQMAFSTHKEANDWARDQKAKGVEVQIVGKGQKTSYHVGTAHKQIKLGGTEEGMRAIGYIAQTFSAHSFPDIGRLPGMQRIKDYTLKKVGSHFVWWDFDPPSDLPANRFSFGQGSLVIEPSRSGS